MKASHCYDVVIVGAGASGLSSASRLLKQKTDLLVLEARSRIGGRVYTRESAKLPMPIELGAEFMHAASPLLLNLVKDAGFNFYDVQFDQLFLKNGKLIEQRDFWERFEKVLALAKADRKKDRSLAEFVHAHRHYLDRDMRSLLIGYIEGFQAADINLIGERSFAKSEGEKRDLNGNNDFRILGPYISVLKQLGKGLQLRSKIRLNHRVSEINWEQKKIRLECQSPSGRKTYAFTKHVVLSVPLGVLKGAHPKSKIEFIPEMPRLTKALSHLHMGHAQRIVFVFKDRFWEHLSEKKPVGFLRAGPDHYFPTWWTYSPLRTPCLVAWQGGPKAQEMGSWTEEKCVDVALSTLALLTRKKKSFLKEQLLSTHHHNWSKDPYSLGSYSYFGVQEGLKSPGIPACFENFLWLTGEAFAPADGQGTVHGAMEHADDVARKILKRL